MTHIKELRLRNWRCFHGEQTIALRPLTYAVVARDIANPDRSNWLGKTSLMEAVRYALTGNLQKGETVKAWITDGEQEGGVDIELSDGAYVSRGRDGGSEKLMYVTPLGVELFGADATAALERYFDESLFDLSFFIAQDATSRLLTMTTTERAATVLGWIGLAPVEEAVANLTKRLAVATREEQALSDRLRVVRETIAKVEGLKAAREKALAYVAELREQLDEQNAIEKNWNAWNHERAAQDRKAAAQDRVIEARVQLARLEEGRDAAPSEEALKRAHTREESARGEVKRLTLLAEGRFDGVCPVDKTFTCPATGELQGRRALHRQALKRAEDELVGASREHDSIQEARAAERGVESRRQRLKAAIEEAEVTIASIPDPVFPSEPPRPRPGGGIMAEYAEAERQLGDVQGELKRAEKAASEEPSVARLHEGAVARCAAVETALRVLGREGVQRRMTERALDVMRDHANAALRSAGVALRLTTRWARELDRLAYDCRVCGHHYGKSQAAKTCPECKAARPRAVEYDLAIGVSDRSGGARDLAGLVFQLSAARWLRARRDWAWGTYMIDEPFGAIDRANRVAMAAQLHGMMEREFGAEQTFVVAHDVDTLESLPARIQITSVGPRRSRIEVVHG